MSSSCKLSPRHPHPFPGLDLVHETHWHVLGALGWGSPLGTAGEGEHGSVTPRGAMACGFSGPQLLVMVTLVTSGHGGAMLSA